MQQGTSFTHPYRPVTAPSPRAKGFGILRHGGARSTGPATFEARGPRRGGDLARGGDGCFGPKATFWRRGGPWGLRVKKTCDV